MKIFRKKEKLVDKVITKDVDAAEVWIVTWWSYYNYFADSEGCIEYEKKAKAFLSEEDAQAFADSLEDATKLLQSENLHWHIEIEKQK